METSASASTASSDAIGFIGLGAMGAPMARHLARLGYRLLVHDVNPRAVQSVVECGARAVASAKAIASEARLVFTCLPSLEALREVALGNDGLHAGRTITTYVDLSTTGANFAREMAGALRQHGIMMLDSPITGNVVTAGNGKLGIMCSGPEAAFRHAEPIMRDLASVIVLYLGDETGRAQRLKLLNNLLSATGMAASCEAFILGVKGGLDPTTMLEIINAGEASSSATRNKFAASILTRRFDFGARMAITAKDISLTVKEAEELGVPMWIAQSVQQLWKYAVSQGGSEKDGTALITYLEPWAGVEVRASVDAVPREHEDIHPQEEIDEHLIVCETTVLTSLARRLREQNWNVAVAGMDTDTEARNTLSYRHGKSRPRRSTLYSSWCSSRHGAGGRAGVFAADRFWHADYSRQRVSHAHDGCSRALASALRARQYLSGCPLYWNGAGHRGWCIRRRGVRALLRVPPGEALAGSNRQPGVSCFGEPRCRTAHAADQWLAVRDVIRRIVRIVRRRGQGRPGSDYDDQDSRN